jgi:hypothetical protein
MSGGSAGGMSGGSAGGMSGGSAGGMSGGSAGGSAGGMPIPAPTLTLTTPAAGTAIAGAMFELIGSVTASAGREVTSATIDVGDGMARPLTLTPTSWRVTVPLPPMVEAQRTFTMSILDQSGQTTTGSVQVLIDTLGPRIALTSPIASTVVGASVMLSGTVTESGGPLMGFSLTGGTVPVTPTVTGTSWTATLPFPPNIDRMNRTVSFTVADALGNSSMGTFTLLVDTQPPALTLSTPPANTAVGRMATLGGTATDSSGAPMNVTLDLGAGPVPLTVVSGAWTTQVMFPANIDRMARPVTLRATDVVGNQATVTVMVLVDTQGPTLAFTSPAASERLGVPRMQTVTGTSTDSTSLMGVTLNCADSGGNRTATISAGTWSVTWPLPTADNVSYTCTATATDSLANVTTLTRSFFVDTVAPVVAFTAPASGAVVGGPSQSMLAVTGTVSDGSAVSPLQVVFGATTNSATPTGTAWSSGFTLPTVDFVSTPISVTATDAEGNATTIMRSVTVDRVAPVVAITAPSFNQLFNIASFQSGNLVNVAWTVTDGDPTRAVHSFNGTTTSTTTGTITTSTNDNGVSYNATVVMRDTAGNLSSSMSQPFYVDRVRPTVLSFSPADGSVRGGNRVASITFSEPLNTPPNSPLGAGIGAGAWTNNNTQWQSGQLTPGTPYQAILAGGLSDLSFNGFGASTSWRFRTGGLLPVGFPGPEIRLATGVSAFDATSDADGQLFVAYRTTASSPTIQTLAVNGVTGTVVSNPNGLSLPAANWDSEVHTQLWSEFASDLSLFRHRALNSTAGGTVAARASYFDSAAVDPGGLPVLTPSMASGGFSPPDGNDDFGLISGTTYTRNPLTVTLTRSHRKIIPGRQHWAAISLNNTSLFRAHRYCYIVTIPLISTACTFDQGDFSFSVPSTVMRSLTGAVSDSNCLMYSFTTSGNGRRVFVGVPQTTDFGTVPTPDGSTFGNFVIAKRLAGGHWGASSSGTVVTIYRTINPAACDSFSFAVNWTVDSSVSVPSNSEIRVVDLGAKPGIVYRTTSNELFLIYP